MATLGSFSPAHARGRPTFVLMSLPSGGQATGGAAGDDSVVATCACHLPSLRGGLRWYAVLGVLSVAALLAWPPNGVSALATLASVRAALRAPKEKVDKVEGDVEMLWDAEGNLQLIRKAKAPALQAAAGAGGGGDAASTRRLTARMLPSTAGTPGGLPGSSGEAEVLGLPGPATGNPKAGGARLRAGGLGRKMWRASRARLGPFLALVCVEWAVFAGLFILDWL